MYNITTYIRIININNISFILQSSNQYNTRICKFEFKKINKKHMVALWALDMYLNKYRLKNKH